MLDFFQRSPRTVRGTDYRFKEPTLAPATTATTATTATGVTGHRTADETPTNKLPEIDVGHIQPPQPMQQTAALPTTYQDMQTFFRRTVAERKSPYNQLCQIADQLKDYIPDEISRLKAAYAVSREQIRPDALSLALNMHIADIDLARQKAEKYRPEIAAAETQRLAQEIALATQQQEDQQLQVRNLQKQLDAANALVQQQQQQLQQLKQAMSQCQAQANAGAFLDQAAENEKNDLLAKKLLLGLG